MKLNAQFSISPHLVFLHGWATNEKIWLPVVSSFRNIKQMDYVLCPYRLLPNQEQTMAQLSSSLVSEQPNVLVGWSLGAALALDFAQQNPGKIDALILIAFNPKFTRQDRTLGWPVQVLNRMKRQLAQTPRDVIEQFYHQLFCLAEHDCVQAFVEDWLDEEVWRTQDELLAGLDYLSRYDLREALENLSIPCLLIHGQEDPICPVAAIQPFRHLHRSAIFDDCGHAPLWTRVQDTAWLIEDFMAHELSNHR